MSEEANLDRFRNRVADSDNESNDSGLDPKLLTGIIDGWEKTRLECVAANREDSFVDGPFGANLLSEEFHEDGFARVIKLQNIRNSEFIDANRKYITKEKFEELERHAAYPNEIAIAKMAEPVARACILPEFEDRYILAAADCVKLDSEADFSNVFVMYSLNSYPVWKQAFSRARGTGRKRINLNQLKEVQIPSPPLEEQRKIANVLYNVDQAIQKTDNIVQQTRRVRNGIIKDAIIARNVDRERKEGVVGTRRVTIPEHWATTRLGDVAKIVSGKSFPQEYQEGHAGPCAVIKVEDMNLPGNDKYIEEATNRVTDEIIDELNKNTFPANTVIHPRVGEALLLNKTRLTTEEAAFDDNIMGWIPEGINPEYLYYASTTVDFNAVAQTGTVPSINKEMAANFRFPLPPEEEQKGIAENLSRIDGQISIYEQEKDQLQRLKRGLMQDLLSGTVRTTDADIEVPEEVAEYG